MTIEYKYFRNRERMTDFRVMIVRYRRRRARLTWRHLFTSSDRRLMGMAHA